MTGAPGSWQETRWHDDNTLEYWSTSGVGCNMPRHLCCLLQDPGHKWSRAELAEERKDSKYKYLGLAYIFTPIAIETSGAIGPRAKAFLKELGRRLRHETGGLIHKSSNAKTVGGRAAWKCCCLCWPASRPTKPHLFCLFV